MQNLSCIDMTSVLAREHPASILLPLARDTRDDMKLDEQLDAPEKPRPHHTNLTYLNGKRARIISAVGNYL